MTGDSNYDVHSSKHHNRLFHRDLALEKEEEAAAERSTRSLPNPPPSPVNYITMKARWTPSMGVSPYIDVQKQVCPSTTRSPRA